MKQPKRSTPQLLLPHLQPDRPPANLSAHKQKDLASALAELLLRAARASCGSRSERNRATGNAGLSKLRLVQIQIVLYVHEMPLDKPGAHSAASDALFCNGL